jgi:hypothetical protein
VNILKKRLALIIMALIMSFATVPVFAENVVKYDMGVRQLDSEDILITESGAGAFKKDKYLYLRCKHVEFEDGIESVVEKGDIKIGSVSVDGDLIKIKISKESTKPSTIKLTNVKLKLDNNLSYGTYPLEIVTEESDDYPNNIFGQTYDSNSSGFDTKYIVLDSNYLTLVKDDNTSPEIKISAAEGNSDGAYIQENRVMLPLRAITEKLNGSAVVSWDDASKTATVMLGDRVASFTVGDNTMNIKGVKISCVSPAEIKNGRMFLSLRDIAAFLGISDEKIKWDDENKTVILNYKE